MGVLLTLVIAAPAGAYSSSASGLVGSYAYSESQSTPFATCGYAGPAGPDNWIWLNWVRVKAPTVMAADRSSDRRDKRTVTFQLKIQRNDFGSTDPWVVVRSSPVQRATAYDDQAAPLSPIKLSYTPEKTLDTGQKGVFRAMVVVRWLKKDGTAEGTVKIWPTYYTVNSPYFSKPYPTVQDQCAAVSTDG